MKWIRFTLLGVLLLSGCGSSFSGSGARPDALVFPPLEFAFPQVAVNRLDNGLRYYHLENHELPLVELTLMVEGGEIYDPREQAGLSRFFAEALATGGTTTLSPEQLEIELEQKAALLSVSSSPYCYELKMSFHRDDLSRCLEILAELLRRPRFAAERVELARKQLLDAIHSRNDNPDEIAGRLLAEAINPGHPLGVYPTIVAVEKFSRRDLVMLHQRYFQPVNFSLGVSGDVTSAELSELLERYFGDWRSDDPFVRDVPLLPQEPRGRILLVDKKLPQTTILLGHRGISKDNPDLYALQIANYILGGGGFNSRLMREIRSNQGLAYSVYSYFQVGRQLPGLFIAGSETRTAAVVKVVNIMRDQLEQLRTVPVSAKELEIAKNSLINSFVFAFENSQDIVSRRVRLDFYTYPDNYLETYRQKLAAVTRDDVLRVARTYFKPEQLQIVLVGVSAAYEDQLRDMGLPIDKVQL